MQSEIICKSIVDLLKGNSFSSYQKAIDIITKKIESLNNAIPHEEDSEILEKFLKKRIELIDQDTHLKKNIQKYVKESGLKNQTQFTEYKNNVNDLMIKLLENIQIFKNLKFESYHLKNMIECYEFFKYANFESIFKPNEILGINFLSKKYQDIFLNRTHQNGELLLYGRKTYVNLRELEAFALNYSNQDGASVYTTVVEYYNINEKGTPLILENKFNEVHFVSLSNFF